MAANIAKKSNRRRNKKWIKGVAPKKTHGRRAVPLADRRAAAPEQFSLSSIVEAATSTAPVNPFKPLTVNALASMTRHDRATVKKRLESHHIEPVDKVDLGNRDSWLYDPAAALAAIFFDKQNGTKTSAQERLANARAEQIERDNAESASLKDGELMLTDDVLAILQLGVKSLDAVKPRAQSELGLGAEQVDKLERILDEARSVWAEKIAELEDQHAEPVEQPSES